ncbi:MAG: hypothetical protein Q8S36_10650 [Sulfuricurvum sp.]|nr:hypothetical protein [Sulfuricurvum sp.]
MASSMDIPVHDIGPLLEVAEYSFTWFISLIVVGFVVIAVLVKQFRSRKKSKEVNERRERYENFSRIDVSNPKAAAYEIGKQGAFFAQDSEKVHRTYSALFKRLEPYKYAPKVEPIDEECLALYEAYCQMIVA